MPLKLSLKPSEAVIVNGAVMRNGDRRGVMVLENKARILREKDVVFPESVRNAAEHAYFALMQLYLTGETEGALYEDAIAALCDVAHQSQDDLIRRRVSEIGFSIAEGDTYAALSKCRKLLKAQGDGHG